MGCNAYNHRPGCDCGWGGVFYGLGLSTGASHWARNDSYTNPNTRCPRCGALVFFYRSPDGGSVYFDDMGPPWPKHPCMDVGEKSHSSKRPKQASASPSWMVDGWHPLPCDGIEIFKANARLIAISISNGQDRMYLYAKRQTGSIKPHSPMLWRRKDGVRGRYEISTFDHSNTGFREVRFDAFSSVDEILAIVRQETVAKMGDPFVKRLDAIKTGLLEGTSISGLAAKMDAIIDRFRLRLVEGGEVEALESLAIASMRSLLAGEISRMEKVGQASALHDVLVAEGRRLMQEFAGFETVLRGPLKVVRAYAVQKLLPADAAAAEMRRIALGSIATHKEQLHRRSTAKELDIFIDELIVTSGLNGTTAKRKMQESARKSLNKNLEIDSIKLNLLEIAGLFKEAAASEAQRLLDKEKARLERLKFISDMLDETCRQHPSIERSFLESSLEKKSNSGTPIEGIRNTLTEIVNGWMKARARDSRFEANTREMQRSRDRRQSAVERNLGAATKSKSVNKPLLGAHHKPFNSVLADKLAIALLKKD